VEGEWCGRPGRKNPRGENDYFKCKNLDFLSLTNFQVTEANERKFDETLQVFFKKSYFSVNVHPAVYVYK
jgi:hypothetical protein